MSLREFFESDAGKATLWQEPAKPAKTIEQQAAENVAQRWHDLFADALQNPTGGDLPGYPGPLVLQQEIEALRAVEQRKADLEALAREKTTAREEAAKLSEDIATLQSQIQRAEQAQMARERDRLAYARARSKGRTTPSPKDRSWAARTFLHIRAVQKSEE